MRLVKPFSFDPERDKDIIKHLEKQPNASAYVRELIRADIESGGKQLTLNKISKLLENYTGVTTPPKEPEEEPQADSDFDAGDINNIMEILKGRE